MNNQQNSNKKFEAFALPLMRQVYPQYISSKLIDVQPIHSPYSTMFYHDHNPTSIILEKINNPDFDIDSFNSEELDILKNIIKEETK